ncbi:MAG: SpoIIE family protein phosphatase, partial [Bacteroidia bacterium]|nr:SpoIIE family protein phosphatase [Bacteroidia bacterium]
KQLEYEFDKRSFSDSLKHRQEMKAGELELASQKAELKHEQAQRYMLYGGLALLLVVAGVVWKAYSNKKKDNIEIQLQKSETERQKHLVEEKQQEIIDSINYAQRIQYALLANSNLLSENLGDHFVLFMPKDIVSGDFYWATLKNKRFYIAACDCTGHGVPGAFMSLLNISFLNEAVNEKNISGPDEVLNHVRMRLIENISQDGGQDGMDATLLWIDLENSWVKYAAAHNQPLVVTNGKATNFPADKMPVGKGERTESFRQFNLPVEKGDAIYLYTDGFPDQFGGPKGKKFKSKQLTEVLSVNSSLSMKEQKILLEKHFSDWKGNLEQIDDVCVIGIKV